VVGKVEYFRGTARPVNADVILRELHFGNKNKIAYRKANL